MGRVIDLSLNIENNMPVYPGDPEVKVIGINGYEEYGYYISKLSINTHIGTHVDAPIHKNPGGKTIDEIPIDRFIGKALVIDFTHLGYANEIPLEEIVKYNEEIKKCDIVLLRTDWSSKFGDEDYFKDFPGISIEAAKWLCSKDIKLLGFDTPSVHPINHCVIHEMLFENEILIVENLTNLKDINNKYVNFYAVPLKLKRLDGSPVRAFAVEE